MKQYGKSYNNCGSFHKIIGMDVYWSIILKRFQINMNNETY